MPWTIPDKGEGDNDLQSVLFQEYLNALVAGIAGDNCVLSGCAVTGGADMTPSVAKGAVMSGGVMFAVPLGDVTIGTADATHPRLDLIVIDSAGAKQVRAGTAAASPKPPNLASNDVLLAVVYVPAGDTAIATSQITDMRVFPPKPIVIYRQTTALVVNNTAAAIQLLNNAAAGLVIPNGLFTTGRMLRVRLWGNILYNNGAPTFRLLIAFGGTTMFNDVSAAAAGTSTSRRAWVLEFMLVAQSNTDQSMTGTLKNTDLLIAIPAPTTGYGDAWPGSTTKEGDAVFGGDSAVDTDAADRTLSVQWTFSVANAANEIVVEGASVELL